MLEFLNDAKLSRIGGRMTKYKGHVASMASSIGIAVATIAATLLMSPMLSPNGGAAFAGCTPGPNGAYGAYTAGADIIDCNIANASNWVLISNTVDMAGGDDVFDVQTAGAGMTIGQSFLPGSLLMGDGNDTVLSPGGIHTSLIINGQGVFDAGSGDDIAETLQINGGLATMGTGNDTLRSNGGAIVTITTINGGTPKTGLLDMGDGDDRITHFNGGSRVDSPTLVMTGAPGGDAAWAEIEMGAGNDVIEAAGLVQMNNQARIVMGSGDDEFRLYGPSSNLNVSQLSYIDGGGDDQSSDGFIDDFIVDTKSTVFAGDDFNPAARYRGFERLSAINTSTVRMDGGSFDGLEGVYLENSELIANSTNVANGVLGSAGSERYFGNGTSSVDQISLLDGSDSFELSGLSTGTYGTVDMGAGADTLDLQTGAAAIITLIDMGADDDTATVDGGTVTMLDMGDGDDTTIWRTGLIESFKGGLGSDTLDVTASSYDASQILDGGDDTGFADGMIDTLTLRGVSLTINGGNIRNWEVVSLVDPTVTIVDPDIGTLQVCNGSANLTGAGAVNQVLGCISPDRITISDDIQITDKIEGAGGEDRIQVLGNASVAGGVFGGGEGSDLSAADDLGDTIVIDTTGSVGGVWGGDDGFVSGDMGDGRGDTIMWVAGDIGAGIHGGLGSDEAQVSASEYDGSQILDGGDDVSHADGMIDNLTLQGITADLRNGGSIDNWEFLHLTQQTSLTLNPPVDLVVGVTRIENASTIIVPASSTIDGDVENSGRITMANANPTDVLTITGDYTGAVNSVIEGDVSFDGNACPSDIVRIGGSASGRTILDLTATGASACGTAIDVVTVEGADSGTVFISTPVIGGLYTYTLDNDGNGTYQLVSAADPVDPGPGLVDPEPQEPGPVIIEPEPVIAPTIDGYADVLTLAQNMGNTIADGMFDRMGGLRARQAAKARLVRSEPVTRKVFCKDPEQDFQCEVTDEQASYYVEERVEASHAARFAVWARGLGGIGTTKPKAGVESEFTKALFQAGADIDLTDAIAGNGTLFVGIVGGYGGLNADAATNPKLETELRGYHAGVYATWWQDYEQGAWVDGLVAYQWNEAQLVAGGVHAATYDVTGWIGALEGGYRFQVAMVDGWKSWIAPVGRIVYQDVTFDQFTDTFGATVSETSGSSLLMSAGLMFEGERSLSNGMLFKPWIRGDLQYEASARNEVSATDGVNTVSGLSDMRGLSYRVTAGTTLDLNDRFSVFGSASASFGMTEEYTGRLGLRYRF